MSPIRLFLVAALVPCAALAQFNDPSNLVQESPLGTNLAAGTTASTWTVYLAAASNNNCWAGEYAWQCALEFEVRTAGTAFSNSPTHSDNGWVGEGYGAFPINYLSSGSYIWQVREVDNSCSGRGPSGWVAFNSGNTAFVIVAPGISASPTSLAFGTVALGSSVTKTVDVSISGPVAVTIQSLQVSGGHASDFSVTPSVPITIAAGGSSQFSVTFKPDAGGTRSATLQLASSIAGTASVALEGVGDGPRVRVGSRALDFGDVRMGASSTRSFLISNVGSTSLSINGLTFGGPTASDFASTLQAPQAIAPGSTIIAEVTFTPKASGARHAEVVVESDDPIEPGIEVALDGAGVIPDIEVTPLSLDFGSVQAFRTLKKTVSIRNAGNAELVVWSATFTGQGAASYSTAFANALIKPNSAPVELEVTFAPTSVGTAAARLTLANDDPTSPSVVIPLQGDGIAPAVRLSTARLDFGAQLVGRTSASRALVVSNTGSAPLGVDSVSLVGGGASAFEVLGQPRAFTLPPGEQAMFEIVARPDAVGEHAARLEMATDDPDAPLAHVELETRGISPAFTVTPAAVDFGAIKVGKTALVVVSLQNLTGDPLRVEPLGMGQPGATFGLNVPGQAVSPGATFEIGVWFAPREPMAYEGELRIGIHGVPLSDAAARIPVSGIGVTTALLVEPQSLDFGDVEVGDEATRTFELKNLTSQPIAIAGFIPQSPDWSVPADLPLQIPVGESATVSARFRPTREGANTGSVSIVVAESDEAGAILVRGRGIPPVDGCGCGSANGALALATLAALALVQRRGPRPPWRPAQWARWARSASSSRRLDSSR